MSNSPSVKFTFENNNVQESTPLNGVSCIITRTTKGPFNDPSEIITSWPQFQRIYGDEVMPDGTISNVKKALALGSKLRVVRVCASETLQPGNFSDPGAGVLMADEYETELASAAGQPTFTLLTFGELGTLKLGVKINGQKDDTYTVTFKKRESSGIVNYTYSIKDSSNTEVESGNIFSYQNSTEVNPTTVDYQMLYDFISNTSYFQPVDSKGNLDEVSFDKLIDSIKKYDQSTNKLTVTDWNSGNEKVQVIQPNYEELPNAEYPGSVDDWVNAFDTIKDYVDVYQITCSSLYNRVFDEEEETNKEYQLNIHTKIAEEIKSLQEFTYYIEIPKTLTKIDDMVAWQNEVMNTIGNSKYIAYFGGGIKYYNESGRLQSCDVIGTILGLGDSSASNYGPWKSFAGANRGIITDAKGPVCPNYGSPSRYDDLNELAHNYINMIVIKDTSSMGKQTMLWHLFTSQVKQDSERFLSIVRLNLYLKKTLRPILEKYIEEPNIWDTWKSIYLEVKPKLDSLVDQNAMSEYTWMGDQYATDYSNLEVNNEADVRQGKYKAILKYKDVVPMQEISIVITIDAASSTVSIDSTDNA
jgi:hypothetical protein|nr:MAG TPA: tail sheath protein [Caudoviricetes sp.]